MIRWLRALLGLHEHQWETVRSGGITSAGKQIGDYFILRCKHCGDVKCRKLM